MELIKIVFVIAITMALAITLTMKSIGEVEEKPPFEQGSIDISTTLSNGRVITPSKRLSRFLAEDQKNPRAADHCQDNERCGAPDLQGNKNHTTACCNNKCVDLSSNKNNCGACKRKCKYTEDCCRGECVLLSFDKRHCGWCNHRCEEHELCVYGLCNYP